MPSHSDIHNRVIRYFSQSVFRRNTLEDILWDIASNCIRELNFVDCVVYLADHERQVLVQKAAYGPKNIDNVQIAAPIEIPFGKGIVGTVAQTCLAEICPDCNADPRYIIDDAKRNSEISVPILYEGKLLGVIDSEHPELGFYTQEHLDILESLASICSSKIAHTLAQQENAEHARFFEESPLPVLRIRRDGRLMEHNKASQQLLEHWNISTQLKENGQVHRNVMQSLKEGQTFSEEAHIASRTYSLMYVPIAERDYCNIFISDITDISEARNAAESANQAKDDFLSVISHEMRTPVNAILGLSTLMEKSGLRGDQLQYAASLKFSANNLLNLINDILDYAKVESGTLQLVLEPFELHVLINSAVTALKGRAGDKGILLQAKVAADVPKIVVGDELRLLQIINNLLSNAIKFTDQGRVTLSVACLEQVNSTCTLRFDVVDTGIGISEEEQTLIYEPFAQASVSTTRNFGGTGLGLAIVNQLLHQHGSQLKLKSAVGEGSTFSFEVNYAVPPVGEQTPDSPSVSSEFQFAGKRFLVVDDNDINRLICEEFLKQWGAEVVSAENGLEAVERVVNEPFDMILMDLQMPVCDGIEATKRIRQLKPTAANSSSYIPILMVTADVFLRRRAEAEQAGVDGFLTKPFGVEELRQGINQLYSR